MRKRHRLLKTFLLAVTILCSARVSWAANQTELTWYGHSAFRILTPQGHVLYLDPWLTNPANPDGKTDLDNISRADLILVSHGHFDHVGDAVAIARKTQARLVATFDLGNALATRIGYPKEQTGYDSLGNFGGTLHFFNDEVRITFIPAIHGSSVAAQPSDPPEYGGNPAGFLIRIKNGPTIYHTGDTDLFGDMTLIPQYQAVDVMLVCIGDHFTMGPARAAEAVAKVRPAIVVPMHYGTFPSVLTGTAPDFQKALQDKKSTTALRVMTIGKPEIF